jgi:hypothetical protein
MTIWLIVYGWECSPCAAFSTEQAARETLAKIGEHNSSSMYDIMSFLLDDASELMRDIASEAEPVP